MLLEMSFNCVIAISILIIANLSSKKQNKKRLDTKHKAANTSCYGHAIARPSALSATQLITTTTTTTIQLINDYTCKCVVLSNIASTASEWDYKEEGPDAWPFLFKTCGGKRQSPVDIVLSKSIYDSKLADMTFSNYDTSLKWNMTYNNHTGEHIFHKIHYFFVVVVLAMFTNNRYALNAANIVVFFPNVPSNKSIAISGSNFNASFVLQQFHLHWGYNNYQGISI